MSAFGRLHMIIDTLPPYLRNTKPSPRPNDAYSAFPRKILLWPGQILEMLCSSVRNCVPDRTEIIHNNKVVDVQFFAHHRPVDNPRIVGKLYNIGVYWSGNGNRNRTGERRAVQALKLLPRGLKTSMFRGFERNSLT